MRALGIELEGSKLCYVLVESNGDEFAVKTRNSLVLTATRSPESLRSFQAAVATMFNVIGPEIVAIKEKPESGRMQAGSAALKMEGIVLANSPVEVDLVSGARVNAVADCDDIAKYQQAAYKSAVSALRRLVV